MLKIHELREIIKLLDQSSIQEFELENEGTKVTIKKGFVEPQVTFVQSKPIEVSTPAVVQASTAVAEPHQPVPVVKVPEVAAPAPQVSVDDESQLHKIVSPMVGTFYSKPEPDAPAYVKVGDKIKPDSIVCILEAMKLFNEIEAEVSGEIVKVLADEGQLVEYGQPLFLVKPE
jgi:acetyl-CoA carboxylase biotin carboxyl carrier protein